VDHARVILGRRALEDVLPGEELREDDAAGEDVRALSVIMKSACSGLMFSGLPATSSPSLS